MSHNKLFKLGESSRSIFLTKKKVSLTSKDFRFENDFSCEFSRGECCVMVINASKIAATVSIENCTLYGIKLEPNLVVAVLNKNPQILRKDNLRIPHFITLLASQNHFCPGSWTRKVHLIFIRLMDDPTM